jgi:uncharacterized protein YukE
MQGRPDAMGMRHAAAQLRNKADRTFAVSARVGRQVGSMGFAGPAANQFRSSMTSEADRLRQVASILHQMADLLDQSAARVDADPVGFYGTGAQR